MHRPQQQVRDLHRDVLNQPTSPAEPQIRMGELRARLILEEAVETVIGLVGSLKAFEMVHVHNEQLRCGKVNNITTDPNIVEVIDGLCDVLVVTYGTAEAMGIDIEPFFDEVHKTNLAKANGPVRADGKRGKPAGWTPPDIAGMLAKVQKIQADRDAGLTCTGCGRTESEHPVEPFRGRYDGGCINYYTGADDRR